MKSPTEEEFEESIKELSEYKNRLEKEVVTISQKLKMPQRKIESINEKRQSREMHGLCRSLVANMVGPLSSMPDFRWDL